MLNKCMVIGNLGRDPEMRYTANGTAQTTFTVAANRVYNDASGQRRDETEWFQVVTWARLAETCAQYLAKGQLVYVEGRIATRSWDDQATGQKRYRTELIADVVRFLNRRDGGGGGGFAPGMAVGPDSEGDIDPDDLPF